MTDEEIIEYMKKNEENTRQLELTANLAVIIGVLEANKLITQSKYHELKEETLETMRKEQVKRMTEEERKQLKQIIEFEKILGK